MKYAELRKLDVSKYVEKKNSLSYLSWAWAVDQLLLHDATATWEYRWHDGENKTLNLSHVCGQPFVTPTPP